MPFLGSRKVKESLEMKLEINHLITANQLHIREYGCMHDYVSSIAHNIGSANDAMDYTVWDQETGLYIRAGSQRSSPASLTGFAGYFHCFTSLKYVKEIAIVNYRMSVRDDQSFNFKAIKISDVLKI